MSSEDPTIRTQMPGETSRLDLDSQPTELTSGASQGNGGVRIPVGSRIANRYTVRAPLGVGGMGAVYRVWDEVLGIDLALKMLRPDIAHDQEFLDRFRNELLVARQVSHRNVVRIHDIGDHQGFYFLTMDLVEGRSLRQLLQEEGRLDLDRALPLVRQITEALAEAHRQGVVHRDLKPANILVDPRGQAFVTDFGIARSTSGPALTRTGEVLGTPDYLSPEQARGEKVDGRSDLYSLGLMFVEMLSGKLPFPGGTLFEILAQRMSAQVPNLVELGIDVPPPYAAIIERCTSPDPEQRYADADELLADLSDLRRPAVLLRRRRLRRVGRWAAFVGLAILAAFGAHRLARPWLSPTPHGDAGIEAAGDGAGTQNESATLSTPPPAHSLAILPPGDPRGLGTLDPIARGLPTLLASELRRIDTVQVVDPERVLLALDGLGIEVDRLRDDHLAQLADLFQVDRLLVPTLDHDSGSPATLELSIYDATRPEAGLASIVDLSVSSPEELLAGWGELLEGAEAQLMTAPESVPGGEARALPSVDLAEGVADLMAGRPENAITRLELSVEMDEGADAVLWLSDAYARAGRPDDAVAALAAAIPSATGGGGALLRLQGRAALLRGDAVAALEHLGGWLERFPYDTESRLSLAEAHGQLGDFPKAVEQLRASVELDAAHPRAWYLLGRYAIGLGEVQAAVDDYLVRALILRRSLRDESGQAEVHNALGVGYQRLGRLDQAIESYGEAVEIRRRLDDRGELAKTLHNLGWVHLAQGDPETAAGHFEEALALHSELGNRVGIATLHNAFGSLEEVRGRGREALDRYRRALQIRDDLGDERALAESHGNVGFTYSLLGEYDNALLHLERALAIHRRHEQPRGIVQALQGIGFARLALGRWPLALEAFEEALPIARQIGAKTEIAVSRGHLGRIAQLQGRYGSALAALAEARDIVTELGDPRGQMEFGLFEAEARTELGDFAGAGALLDVLHSMADGDGIGLAQKARLILVRVHWRLAKPTTSTGAGGGPAEGGLAEVGESLVALLDRAAELAEASQDRVVVLEVEHARVKVALGAGDGSRAPEGSQGALVALAEKAERLGHLGLRLRLAETLARVELATEGDPVGPVREALRLVNQAGGWGGTYRLQKLLEQALVTQGDTSAANRAAKLAAAEIERLRSELGEGPLRDAFEALLEG